MESGARTVDARGCPSDEELADFVEHALARPRRAQIEAHLDRCTTCREAIGHVASTVEEKPKQIGRYRLDKKLGAGGMGVVWQAWDPALEREIAIKLLHPELHDSLGRERAIREARALARLQHPNVVAVYDVGEHEGDVFIATELIDGESLDRWQKGRTTSELLSAYAQAARGLQAAHALGLVHRDVKPSNILVARDGRVRVGDFGLATNAAASSLQRPSVVTPARTPLPKLTHDGERLGTPAYMAPEQQHSTSVDARADQFSLCLALTEALLGKQPGADPTVDALAESGVVAPWAAIARGLSTKPGERFPDLAPLVAALEGTRPYRARRRVWIGAGLAAAALVGVIAWRVVDRSGSSTPTPTPTTPTTPLAGGGGSARTSPTPTTVLPTWTWMTPTTGAWRLLEGAYYIAVADEQHAIAVTFDQMMVIDLQTGAVTAPVEVLKNGGRFDGIVRAGGRVLGFGMHDDKPVAWSLSISPPSATEIPLTDPVPTEPPSPQWGGGIVASGDGARIAICLSKRWPTIRDAKTLEVIRVAKGIECGHHPRFPDANHVVLGDFRAPQVLDLATGAVAKLSPSAPTVTQGPGGRSFSVGEESYKILGPGGAVLRTRRSRDHLEDVTFSPDGKYVVGLRMGTLTIRPTDDEGMDREIDLPTSVVQVDVTNQMAVIVAENVALAVDFANGTVRHATGNLESIRQIAPRGGSVVVASDRLRLWREGKLVATTDQVSEFAVAGPTDPITVLGMDFVGLWDPSSGERRMLRTFEHLGLDAHLAQAGEAYAFNDGKRIYRGKGDAPPTPWFTFRDDLALEAIDLAHERIALKSNDVMYVVDLVKRTVWPVTVPAFEEGACDAGMSLKFAPDGNRFAVDTAGAVILFDIATHKRIGDIDIPKMMQLKWNFLPTGEILFAGPGDLAIWDPKTSKAIGWKPPIKERPVELAIDTAGGELAVGYANGSLLWADVAQLRLHATQVDSTLEPATKCADKKTPQPKFEQLVMK